MRWLAALAATLVLISDNLGQTEAATLGAAVSRNTRRLAVTRTFEIPVTKGERTIAAIPALMSFWGATNQQVIVQSDFTYSQKPDKIEVTADDRGMKRRNYELTWDAPQADKITVTQRLTVEIGCTTVLYTAARLPYPKEVAEKYAPQLADDDNVNPDNARVDALAKDIAKRAATAEEAVELACDWINDNIKFTKGADEKSDTILANAKGNCTGMSYLACAIIRKLGIPADPVDAVFIGDGTGGHEYIEVYYPDAGWVFYDLSNWNRGFKSLDCLLTAGWCFRVRAATATKDTWIEGHFCVCKDAGTYKADEEQPVARTVLRPGPKNNVVGARIINQKPPETVPVRQQPISALLMDLSVPPGKRQYVKDSAPTRTAAPTASAGAKPTSS